MKQPESTEDILTDEDLEVLSQDPHLMPEEKSTVKQLQEVRQIIRQSQNDIRPLKDELEEIHAEIKEGKIPASQVAARRTRAKQLQGRVEQLKIELPRLNEKNRHYIQVLKRLEQIRQKTTYRTAYAAHIQKNLFITFPEGQAFLPGTKIRRGIGIAFAFAFLTASLAPVLILGINPLYLIGTIIGACFSTMITAEIMLSIGTGLHDHVVFSGVIPKHALELYEKVKTNNLFDAIVVLSEIIQNEASLRIGTTAILSGVIFSHPHQRIKFKNVKIDYRRYLACSVKDTEESYFFSLSDWKVGKERAGISS